MKKNITIRVSGLVQGVFFRASTKKRAESLNISGFVRNEPDGSVYVEAEGLEGDLRKFVEWCQHGPANAKVTSCDVHQGTTLKGFKQFVIER